jgi:hypothetical protein
MFKKGWKLAGLRMAMKASSEQQRSNCLGRNVLGLLAIAAHALAPPAFQARVALMTRRKNGCRMLVSDESFMSQVS